MEWSVIKALMSSHLVALDKCPGVRPIAIGEIPRRILCKAKALATSDDIAYLCEVGSALLRSEGVAVHAIRKWFEEHHTDGWGLLLMDASNMHV